MTRCKRCNDTGSLYHHGFECEMDCPDCRPEVEPAYNESHEETSVMTGMDLRTARLESELTQEQLGRAVGLKNWEVCDIERGRKALTPELEEKITDALTSPNLRRRGRGPTTPKIDDFEVARQVREGFSQFVQNCAIAEKRGILVNIQCMGQAVDTKSLELVSIHKSF